MNLKNAYSLFHYGQMALATAQKNGIRMDLDHCEREQTRLLKEMDEIEKKIFSKKIGIWWKKEYGEEASLLSNPQLSNVLFNKLKLTPSKTTPTGQPSVDKDSLSKLDHPLIKAVLDYRKYQKLTGTYLRNIIEETNEDGFLRPVFNLQLVSSYRSSSDSPNFQNVPIRDPESGKAIRKAFIPRKGGRLVEIDFKGLEVSIAACYHQDPVMIQYLTDPSSDMHRDAAADIFKVEKDEVSKEMRYAAKNRFVFPEFYGSYYKQVAPALWDSVTEFDLQTTCCEAWMTKDDFMEHIRQVEDIFWNKRFKVYTKWKEKWYADYLKNGYFDTLTGFRFQGSFKRNQVLNLAVQGAAFHVLLWCFIELTKELKSRRMRSLLIGQIHDSIVADVPTTEYDQYIDLVRTIMSERIINEWDWIIVPLSVDGKKSEVDGNWYECEEFSI